jgi:hypothetical protein
MPKRSEPRPKVRRERRAAISRFIQFSNDKVNGSAPRHWPPRTRTLNPWSAAGKVAPGPREKTAIAIEWPLHWGASRSWDEVAWAIVWPRLSFKAEYLMAIVAMFGTTISPYPILLAGRAGGRRHKRARAPARWPERRNRPPGEFTHYGRWPGPLTFVVFAVGIIRTGMLALAGSAAYALGEALAWHVSLAVCRCVPRRSTRPRGGHGAGRGTELLRHRSDPGALWERGDDATDHAKVDHDGFTLPLPLQVMGWLATAAMAVTVVAMIASWLE